MPHRIYSLPFANLYPLYVQKLERKGRTTAELDEVITWLTGYSAAQLGEARGSGVDLESFFRDAPAPNPARSLITGVICGVRLEEIEEDTMREIRYLDKLVDELAKGRAMERVLRS